MRGHLSSQDTLMTGHPFQHIWNSFHVLETVFITQAKSELCRIWFQTSCVSTHFIGKVLNLKIVLLLEGHIPFLPLPGIEPRYFFSTSQWEF